MHQVVEGMTKQQVKQLLGEPTRRDTLGDYLRHQKSAIFMSDDDTRATSDYESWAYTGVPEQGRNTFIWFVGGRVSDVTVRRAE